MDALERQFEQDLIRSAEQQRLACGWNPVRFLQKVSKDGAVKTAKRLAVQGRPSEALERLAQQGQLGVSFEALIVQARYAPLFTDEEVNACFDTLCRYGYYG